MMNKKIHFLIKKLLKQYLTIILIKMKIYIHLLLISIRKWIYYNIGKIKDIHKIKKFNLNLISHLKKSNNNWSKNKNNKKKNQNRNR